MSFGISDRKKNRTRDFGRFLGEFLRKAILSSREAKKKKGKGSFSLAGLWTAVGAVIGLNKLTKVVQESDSLKQALMLHTEELEAQKPTDAPHLDTLEIEKDATSTLGISTHLLQFSEELRKNAKGLEKQKQYIVLLEQLKNQFQMLQNDFEKGVISQDELGEEVKALFNETLHIALRSD